MMIDPAAAIDVFSHRVTLLTNGGGAYLNGEWVEGTEALTNVQATIQPAQGRKLEDVPEGVRNEARFLVWSREELKVNQHIVDGSNKYRILHIWPRDAWGFTRAAMGLVRE